MPTLTINGQRVRVDDSFLSLSPEQQNATVEEIARSMGQQEPYSGTILPLSRDVQGNVSFDSNAGILGAVKRAFTLPGDVLAGEVDPTSQEGIERAFEFASTVSPINPMVRSGERIVPGAARALVKADVPVPTQQQLFEESGRNFRGMRDTGVDYLADAVKNVAAATKARLEQEGFDAEVAGKTHRILDKLASPPEGSVANIRGLHSARKTFGKIAQNFNDPTDQSAATQAIKGLDEFIAAADEAAVVAGTPSDAADLLRAGNANYAAAKRSETLTDLTDAAQLRANAANSGANGGNTTRQRIASLLLNDKASSGFSTDEIAALRGVNEGSLGANATRRVGNMLGGGGGIGASMIGLGGAGLGAITGSPEATVAGAALPLAGAVTRELSNILTERALRAVERDVRKRSPLYEQMVADAPLVPDQPTVSPALIRALMLSQQSNGGAY